MNIGAEINRIVRGKVITLMAFVWITHPSTAIIFRNAGIAVVAGIALAEITIRIARKGTS